MCELDIKSDYVHVSDFSHVQCFTWEGCLNPHVAQCILTPLRLLSLGPWENNRPVQAQYRIHKQSLRDLNAQNYAQMPLVWSQIHIDYERDNIQCALHRLICANNWILRWSFPKSQILAMYKGFISSWYLPSNNWELRKLLLPELPKLRRAVRSVVSCTKSGKRRSGKVFTWETEELFSLLVLRSAALLVFASRISKGLLLVNSSSNSSSES